MGKKSTKNNELGRALARKHQQKTQNRNAYNTANAQIAAAVGRHTERGTGHMNLVSVLEANDLDELMNNAALANETFAAERYAQPIPASQSVIVVTPTSYNSTDNERRKHNEHELRIPRRPHWTSDMTFEQLMQNEEQAFLTWRRNIADLENEISGLGDTSSAMQRRGTGAVGSLISLSLTPFEKNLDVWRQLWRVAERSHVILQIVDARNPLLFACTDLVRYVVDEMHKKHILVMNKADLLSPQMVDKWARYFEEKGIDVVFFSAFAESIAQPVQDQRVVNVTQLIQRLEAFDIGLGHEATTTGRNEKDSGAASVNNEGNVMVGLCGYPNVGKSSTINVLIEAVARHNQSLEEQAARVGDAGNNDNDDGDDDSNDDDDETRDGEEEEEEEDGEGTVQDNVDHGQTSKSTQSSTLPPKPTLSYPTSAARRVGVSSTPGKTKHFQTLPLTDRVTLCDCPGLVFPNFAASKSELICAGVLSIDTMRGDYETPVSVIVSRIPYSILAAVYGLTFSPQSLLSSSSSSAALTNSQQQQQQPRQYVSAETFLDTHARARGFMTDHGRPDRSRSARVVLKDFVSGRLVYAHAPPSSVDDDDSKHKSEAVKGEAAVGAAVFAKKGKLVHRRLEQHEQSMLLNRQQQKNATAAEVLLARGDTAGFEQLDYLKKKLDGVGAAGDDGSGSSVRALVSGGKKKGAAGPNGKRRGRHQQKEFVRVERTYDASSSSSAI